MVLVAEDVTQDSVFLFTGVLDEAHGDTADGLLNGYTSVHEGERAGADGSHGAGTVALQDVANDTDGVGIVCGNLTLQGAPCEVAVTNLTTAYAALCLSLTRGEGGEVVVEQEAHVAAVEDIVHELLVELRAEGDGGQGLCLATREDAASVRAGQGADLAPDGADVGGAATVEADAFVEDATAHSVALHVVVVAVHEGVLLLQLSGVHVGVSSSVALLEVLADLLEGFGACVLLQRLLRHVVGGLVALLVHLLAQLLVVDLVAVFALDVLAEFLGEFLLQAAHGLDGFVGYLQGLEQILLADLLHLAFHHHDVLFCGTDHDVHVGILHLLEGGIHDVLAVQTNDAHLGDGTFEGDVTHAEGSGSGEASEGIGHIHAVGAVEVDIHIHLSMVVAGEEGTKRTIDEATGEDFVIVSLTFALREATGETAGSGIFLAIFYLKGHEIGSGNGILGGTNGGQEHRISHSEHHGSVCLLSKLTSLDGNLAAIGQLDCLGDYVHLVI